MESENDISGYTGIETDYKLDKAKRLIDLTIRSYRIINILYSTVTCPCIISPPSSVQKSRVCHSSSSCLVSVVHPPSSILASAHIRLLKSNARVGFTTDTSIIFVTKKPLDHLTLSMSPDTFIMDLSKICIAYHPAHTTKWDFDLIKSKLPSVASLHLQTFLYLQLNINHEILDKLKLFLFFGVEVYFSLGEK